MRKIISPGWATATAAASVVLLLAGCAARQPDYSAAAARVEAAAAKSEGAANRAAAAAKAAEDAASRAEAAANKAAAGFAQSVHK